MSCSCWDEDDVMRVGIGLTGGVESLDSKSDIFITSRRLVSFEELLFGFNQLV